jgi:MFS family permease
VSFVFLKKICNNEVMRAAYWAWLSVAIFYFYQYILRIAPGVMVDQMMSGFMIKAEQFSTLGFLDTFAYGIMQIPLGIIVDRIGVKKTVLSSLGLCIIASFIYAVSEYFWMIQLSRTLSGIGSAAAFMCALKTIADHFIPGQRAVLMGLTLTIGMCGALFAGKFIITVIEVYDWRYVFFATSILGIIIMLFSCRTLATYSANKKSKKPTNISFINSVWKVMTNYNIIIYAILAIGLYVPLSVLADLWGTAFMQQKYGFSQADSAYISSLLYFGLGIGSVVLPWIAEKNNMLNTAIFWCGLAILSLFSLLLYSDNLSYNQISAIMLGLGFFCGAEMMCFTGALLFADENNSGEVIGVVNTFNMLGGSFMKYWVGISLDATWEGAVQPNGLRFYSAEQYVEALSMLTLLIMLCCVVSMLLFVKQRS